MKTLVQTNVIDVLPDGTITEVELTVPDGLTVRLCRNDADEMFKIKDVDVLSGNSKILTIAMKEINHVLLESGAHELTVDSMAG